MVFRKASRLIIGGFSALIFCSVYWLVLQSSVTRNWMLLPMMAAMLIGYLFIHHYDLGKRTFRICFAIMVILQFLSMYFLRVTFSTWDVYAVTKNAAAIVHGEWYNARYFARYPNNIAMLLITTAVYSVSNLLFHSTSVYFMLIANIFMIDVAVLLSIKTMRLLLPEQAAYRGGILLTLFSPYYLYVPICYTDTFVMPFIIGIVYLALSTEQKMDRLSIQPLLLRFCLMGMLILLAFRIKGSALILLIACGLFFFFRFRLKDFLRCAACLIASFVVASMVWNSGVRALKIVPDEYYYEEQFPLTHWVMMGLKGTGGWNNEDVNEFTMTFSNYDERRAAVNEELMRRLNALGPIGLIKQFYNKATTYTWNYGTCFAERYLGDTGDKPTRPNFLHSFVLTKGENHHILYLFTQSYWLLLFGFTASGFIVTLRRDSARLPCLLTLALVGCMVFFMIWETHPRYVLHFTPILLLIATTQLESFADFLRQRQPRLFRKAHLAFETKGEGGI